MSADRCRGAEGCKFVVVVCHPVASYTLRMLSSLARPKPTGAQPNPTSRISDKARRRLEMLLLLVGAFAVIATEKLPEDNPPLEPLSSLASVSGRQVLTAEGPKAELRFRLAATGPLSALEGQHAALALTGLVSPSVDRAEAVSGGKPAADLGAAAPLPLMDQAGAAWVRVDLRGERAIEQGGQGGVVVLQSFARGLPLALGSCDTVGLDRVSCVSRAVVELELVGEPAPTGVDWRLDATFALPREPSTEGAAGAPAGAPEVVLSLSLEEGEQE